jgi:GntR family transcriptional regulator, trigonelline degradation regulator
VVGTFSGEAIKRPPALVRDQVAAQIREAIADGELLPGQVLIERELCEATTASRASVREALRLLESEGLVTATTGKGTVVTTLSAEQALELYEVRSTLEGLAGWLFAQRATEDDREALRLALKEVEAAAPDIRGILAAKGRFYRALMQGARNDELRLILEGVNRRATAVRAVSLSQPGRAVESIKEIQEICRAAIRGDADTTERLCKEHVRRAAEAGIPSLDRLADDRASVLNAPVHRAAAKTRTEEVREP